MAEKTGRAAATGGDHGWKNRLDFGGVGGSVAVDVARLLHGRIPLSLRLDHYNGIADLASEATGKARGITGIARFFRIDLGSPNVCIPGILSTIKILRTLIRA